MNNKWYLYAINGSDVQISQYYYYFLLITNNRMIYSGGCTIKWSPYNIKDNTLSGLDTLSFIKPACL